MESSISRLLSVGEVFSMYIQVNKYRRISSDVAAAAN